MDLRQLQHFVAVAEEQHFTRAAQRVNIVQSALSTSIRGLEEEFEVKLFLRNTRQVRLTAAGQILLEKARGVLEAMADTREAVEALKGFRRGILKVGTVHGLPAFLDLPLALAEFHHLFPEIEVRLSQGSAESLQDKLRGGQLDLAFLPLAGRTRGLATRMVACEELVVVCAPDHRLAGRKKIGLAALTLHPFVDFEADLGTRHLIDQTFRAAGLERHTAFEVSDLDTLLDLVARGLGVALLPNSIAVARQDDVTMVALSDIEICWEVAAAYPSNGKSTEPAEALPRRFLDLMDGLRSRDVPA